MFRVVASSSMPIDIVPILGPGIALDAPNSKGCGVYEREELLVRAESADALITLLTVDVDAELLARPGDLRLVANFAVGTDNIDISLATQNGVVITNTPDVLTEATADFTFALLLSSARRIIEGDQLARSGNWSGWHPALLLGKAVGGQTLGIVGMGRIGRAVARRARGFGMNVICASPGVLSSEARELATQVSISELAHQSDFVALHCPLTDETHHLVDASFLAAMKPTAILINTARGGCVDETALCDALESHAIAGAGLDVFSAEPTIDPRLLELTNVVLAPHTGSATLEARTKMATICAEACVAMASGECPATALNPQAFRGGVR